MSIDSYTLSEARNRGYSDDQIYEKVIQKDPMFAEVRKRGYTLDQIASKYDSLKPKEVTENEASKTQSNLEGNAQRASNQQGQAGSRQGTLTSQEPTNGNGQVGVGQINPSGTSTEKSDVSLTENGNEESTKTESKRTQQGTQVGQTVRPEVSAGNEAQVGGGEVPSLASKAIGGAVAPIAYLGQEMYKGIAGISRQLGADQLAQWATDQADTNVEQMVNVFGGTAPTSKAGQLAAQTVGTLAALPATIVAGIPGLVAGAGLGFGAMREDLRKKYLEEGLDEKEADKKAAIHAGINTAVTLPLYMLGGKIAGKAADAILGKNAKEITNIATRFGLNTLANSTASAISRGIGAGLEGESVGDAMKDFSISGFLQDMAFAGHATGEHLKEQAKIGKLKEALTKLSDVELDAFSAVSKNEQHKTLAAEEKERRKATEGERKELEAAGLPETAKEATATLPTKDPDARVHNFLSLADDFIAQGDRYSANRAVQKAMEAIEGAKGASPELQEQRNQRINELNEKLDKLPMEAPEKPAEAPVEAAAPEQPTEARQKIDEILGVGEPPARTGEQAARDLNAAKAAEAKGAKESKEAEAAAKAAEEQKAQQPIKGMPLVDAITRGHIFEYQGGRLKLLKLTDEGVVARDLKTKQEILLPKGEMEGAPEGIEGLKLVKLGQEKKAPQTLSEVMTQKSEKIGNIQKLENWANETVDRIRSEGRLNVGFDPEYLSALSVKTAFQIAKGVKSFAEWSAQMLKEHGEGIKEHLKDIWAEAKKIHDNPERANQYLKAPEKGSVKNLGLDVMTGKAISSGMPYKPRVDQVARYFQSIIKEPIPYGKDTPAQRAELVSNLLDEVRNALKLHPEAQGWYDENLSLAMRVMKEIDPSLAKPENDFIFKAILAVTSDGNRVKGQFKQAWNTYKHWRDTGEIVGDFADGERIENIKGNIKKIEAIHKILGADGASKFLSRKGTVKELREACVKELGMSKEKAKEIASDDLIDEVVPFSNIFGPKLGSFFNNLYGDYSSVTMDRWFMRTFGRLTGTQLIEKSKQQINESRQKLRSAFAAISKEEKNKIGLKAKDFVGEAADKAAIKLATYFQKDGNYKTVGGTPIDILRKAANRHKRLDRDVREDPDNGTHRRWIRGIINDVQAQLKKEGINLENADLQALLWYSEKELYDKLDYKGSKEEDGESVDDYASAAAEVHERETGKPSTEYATGTGRVGAIGRSEKPEGVGGAGAEKVDQKAKIESWADGVIQEAKGRLNIGIDPEVITAHAIKAAYAIARGARDFAKWSAEMIREHGENIKPHLEEIWAKAQDYYKEIFKQAEAGSEAQPKTPSEEQKQKAGRVSPEQRQPSIGKAEGQAQEGTPQREGEGQEKIAAAAYRQPETGDIYTGEDHQDAAAGAGFEAPKNPADRETPEYGYMTTSGRFVSREEGEQIAKAAGQFKGKSTDRPVMHSTETEMTDHPETPKSMPADTFSKNPKKAMAVNIAFGIDKYIDDPELRKNIRDSLSGKADISSRGQKAFQAMLKKLRLTRDDVAVLGITPKGTRETGELISYLKKGVQTLADIADVRRIGNLSRAGVKEQAYQHAAARIMVGPMIEDLLAKVFPTSYKNKEEMAKTMDIIVKDNILSGYDDAIDELNKIKTKLDDAKSSRAEKIAFYKEKGRKITVKTLDKEIEEISARYNNQSEFVNNIRKSHDIEQYKKDVEAAKGTEIEENIKRWRDIVNPVMDELYLKMKDDENAPIEQRGKVFGARVNLLANSEVENLRNFADPEKQMPEIKVSNYRNPDVKMDRLMNRAKYNEQYSTDANDILLNSLATRLNETTKIDLYNALVKNNAAIILEPGEEPPVKSLNGEKLVRMPIKMPVTDPETNRTRMKERNLWVQNNLVTELEQVLNVNRKLNQHPVFQQITKLQLLSFADATSHLKNLHAILTGTLAGESSTIKEVMRKIPFANSIRTVAEINSVIKELNESSPRIRAELADLAKKGLLRPHYEVTPEGKTFSISSPFSKLTQLVHDVDTATRVIMNRRYDNLIKYWKADPSPEARIDFISQVGEYNRRLMGRFESVLKDSGFSPFIVAGRAMSRYSRKLILADPGFKTAQGAGAKAAFAVRAAQASGLIFTGLMAMTINAIFNNGNIFGRTGTPLGAVDFGPQFDTEDGKRRTFDLFQLVNIRRGLRQMGINAAVEGWRQGKSWTDIQRDAISDIRSTSLHPFIGPGPGLLYELGTGSRIDLRQGYATTFDARKIEGFGGLVENLRVGLRQQNELLYNLGLGWGIEKAMEKAGIPRPAEEAGRNKLYGAEFPQNIPFVSQVGNIVYGTANNIVGTMGGKLQVSPALKLASQYGQKQQYDPIQDLRYEARTKILEHLKKGDAAGASEVFTNAYRDGILTKADLKTLKGKITQPDILIQRVSRLKEAKDAVRVFRVAMPEEQDRILQTVFKKVKGSTTLTEPMKKALFEEMKAHAQEGTVLYKMINE